METHHDPNLSGQSPSVPEGHEEWSKPQGGHIPLPTYMPAVLALGVMCMLWGIVTTYLVTLVGVVLFVAALSGWIGDLRDEHRRP